MPFFLWCYVCVCVCFVLLRFLLYAFVEAAALCSIVLRYAGTPIATRVSFFLFFPFVYVVIVYVAFSEYIYNIYILYGTISSFSLNGEYGVRSFLPDDGVSLPCDYGLDFLYHLM